MCCLEDNRWILKSVTSTSGMVINESPIRTYAGHMALKSFSSEDYGVIGREFKIAYILVTCVYNFSKETNASPTMPHEHYNAFYHMLNLLNRSNF